MPNLVIRPTQGFADLIGEVPHGLASRLTEELSWMGTDDLSRVIEFYSAEDQLMYPGVMYRAQGIIADWARENEVDLTCSIELPPLPKKKFKWTFRTDHLPGKVNPKRLELQEAFCTVGLTDRFVSLSAVPGFGKTFCMARMTAEIGQMTNIMVQNEEPFNQAIAELEACLGVEVGKIKGSAKKVKVCAINVVMVQTFNAMLDSGDPRAVELSKAKVVMIDECHNAAADSYLRFLDTLTDPWYIIGVSATPFRHDDKGPILHARLGDVRFECPFDQAIDAEILVPMYLFCQRMPERKYGYAEDRNVPTWERRKQYAQVVKEQVYHNEVRHRALIEFADYAWNEAEASCAIITDSIPHMEHLCKMDPTLVMVHGNTKPKERKEIWEALRRKDITRVTTTLMDEATNVTSLGAVALAPPGKSKVSLIQRQRQLRWFEGETSYGHYKKPFGLTYLPIDQTDFLRSHANENRENLMREFIDKHSACRLYDLGTYGE
jgi:hypothetical protein